MKKETILEKGKVEALKENMKNLLSRIDQFIHHEEYKNIEWVGVLGDVQQMIATQNPTVECLFKEDQSFSTDLLAAICGETFIINDGVHETYDIEKLKRRRDNIHTALELLNHPETDFELGDVAAILNTVVRLVYPSITYQNIVSYLESPHDIIAEDNIDTVSDEPTASNDLNIENPVLALIENTIAEMSEIKEAIERVIKYAAKNTHWKKELEKTNALLVTLHHARQEEIEKPDPKEHSLLENLRIMALHEKARDHIISVSNEGERYCGSQFKMAKRALRKAAHHVTKFAATVATARSEDATNDEVTPEKHSDHVIELPSDDEVPLVTSKKDVVEKDKTLSKEETASIIKGKNYLNAKLAVYEANTKTQIAAKAEKLARFEKLAAVSPVKMKGVEKEIERLEYLKLRYEGHLEKIVHTRAAINASSNDIINKTSKKTPAVFIETYSKLVDECKMKPYHSKISHCAPVLFFKAKATEAKAAIKTITTPPTQETLGERLKREFREAVSFIKPK